jgi:4-amino-4-deoxy-L-arabinose transferase-like glycosyltransferase
MDEKSRASPNGSDPQPLGRCTLLHYISLYSPLLNSHASAHVQVASQHSPSSILPFWFCRLRDLRPHQPRRYAWLHLEPSPRRHALGRHTNHGVGHNRLQIQYLKSSTSKLVPYKPPSPTLLASVQRHIHLLLPRSSRHHQSMPLFYLDILILSFDFVSNSGVLI